MLCTHGDTHEPRQALACGGRKFLRPRITKEPVTRYSPVGAVLETWVMGWMGYRGAGWGVWWGGGVGCVGVGVCGGVGGGVGWRWGVGGGGGGACARAQRERRRRREPVLENCRRTAQGDRWVATDGARAAMHRREGWTPPACRHYFARPTQTHPPLHQPPTATCLLWVHPPSRRHDLCVPRLAAAHTRLARLQRRGAVCSARMSRRQGKIGWGGD